jgi:hypothetical protein
MTFLSSARRLQPPRSISQMDKCKLQHSDSESERRGSQTKERVFRKDQGRQREETGENNVVSSRAHRCLQVLRVPPCRRRRCGQHPYTQDGHKRARQCRQDIRPHRHHSALRDEVPGRLVSTHIAAGKTQSLIALTASHTAHFPAGHRRSRRSQPPRTGPSTFTLQHHLRCPPTLS